MSDPIQKICQILANKLQAGSSHNTNEIVTSLRAELDVNPSLIEALQKDERVVQINLGDSKGFQTLVEEGGIANIGNHYHLDTHEVVQQLAQVLQELIAQRPTSTPNNLPRSGVKEFVGRNQKLQDLHEQLQNSQRIAITAIAGMGGIGKTELALQYAISQLELKHYPGGFCWLRARDQEIATQIVTFAQTKLDLTLPDGLDEQGQVDYCWGHWREGNVLVVLDDVTEFDAIEPYLPPSDPKFKVLLTTRLKLGSSVQSLSIEELDDENALTLLETLVGSDRIQSQLEDAKTLCDWVGNLPLGLELLGRFLARRLDWSLKKLIERLESKKLKARALIVRESGMTAQIGVAAALELSWIELSEVEQELACLLGMFAVAPIPWHLVEGCLPERDKDDLEDIRDEGLIARNLLKRVEQSTYQLHQIVQEFFRIKLSQQAAEDQSLKAAYCKGMVVVAKSIEHHPIIQKIEEMRSSLPHLEEVINQWINFLDDDELIWPFVGIGRFYEGQGNYELALSWREKCLELTQQRLDSHHPSVAHSLVLLANLYNSQGWHEKAEPLYLHALQIYQTLLDAQLPELAKCLVGIGLLYKNQGRYKEAESFYNQALPIFKELCDEYSWASTLNDLAYLYYNQGQYEKAEVFYSKALQMSQELLDSECTDASLLTIIALNGLGLLLRNQRRYEEAKAFYSDALSIASWRWGSKHPMIATSQNNLGVLYYYQEYYEEAESYLLQALESRQKHFREDHPDIAQSLNNLAALYEAQKRKEAKSYYIQALEMRQRIFGSEHPDIAVSLQNLGNFYKNQEYYEEAVPYLLQALKMYKNLQLVENHPSIVATKQNLNYCRQKIKEPNT